MKLVICYQFTLTCQLLGLSLFLPIETTAMVTHGEYIYYAASFTFTKLLLESTSENCTWKQSLNGFREYEAPYAPPFVYIPYQQDTHICIFLYVVINKLSKKMSAHYQVIPLQITTKHCIIVEGLELKSLPPTPTHICETPSTTL